MAKPSKNNTPGVFRSNIIRQTYKLITENWFLSVFFACIAFVGMVSVYKLFFVQEQFVYAKVKVSQGLWWASTQKPPIWFTQALKPGMVERGLTGAPVAQILKARYYSYYGSNQYDIFLTLKLKVNGNPKTGTLNFNRSTLAVGSPIELAFPSAEISGTVLQLRRQPFKDKLVEKTIVLIKTTAYPWEYDVITVGDSYFDGEDQVLKIVDKQVTDSLMYGIDAYGSNSERSVVPLYPQLRQTIIITVKLKVLRFGQQYLYGEEQELRLGKGLSLSTNSFYFQDYQITDIR